MNDNRETKTLGKVIHIDEAQIQDHLGELVRDTVEETFNALILWACIMRHIRCFP